MCIYEIYVDEQPLTEQLEELEDLYETVHDERKSVSTRVVMENIARELQDKIIWCLQSLKYSGVNLRSKCKHGISVHEYLANECRCT
jgi:hypothetical protein